ncbi:MAG TPA: nucleoside-diphosphate sugar epimerase/dehydratase [Bacillota bacterium]|nr:nucleoside-diphosphate sugar epimerase/dehydratase [Bacillota bacterium]
MRFVERSFIKHLIFVSFDLIAVNAALFIAFLLRFEGTIPPSYQMKWWLMVLFVSVIRIFFFHLFGLYKGLWRYSSLPELFQVIYAVTLSSVVIWAILLVHPFVQIPRSVGAMAWLINIVLISSVRLTVRLRHEALSKNRQGELEVRRVLIIGAGSAGSMIVQQMKLKSEVALLPIAFLDDAPDKLHRSLHGLPVVGRVNDLPKAVARYQPDEILIAIPSLGNQRMKEIVALAAETNLPVRTLPNILDLDGPDLSIGQIREIKIEDLLGREPVKVDLESIANYLKEERILVTGAGGSIGSELCRQVAGFSPEALLLLGRGENSIYEIDQELGYTYGLKLNKVPIIADIRDRSKLEQVFQTYRPTVVFHAAAHKHVPLMEYAPDEAIKNNVFGTKNVAELSAQYGVKHFVMISTDKAVNPTSVMGATKRIAEIVIQNLARTSTTNFCAVRFGNVLGSRGSVVPLFKKQIARGGPITVTHPEMKRFFMTIPEAVHLVIQAGSMGKGGEVFILDMGEQVKIVDLAKELIRLSGLVPGKDITIKYSGIRPGEKLYEELLTDEEGTDQTKHKRIFVGKPNGVDWDSLANDLEELWQLAQSLDQVAILNKIKEIVPQFNHQTRTKKEVAVGQFK